jgi:protein gp37
MITALERNRSIGVAMENSKIEWTDHTFNPWIGCTKVSPLCEHCYAEALMDTRYKRVIWGPEGTRVRTTEQYWRKPIAWNRDWAESERRRRVFCGSLADVYEDRSDLQSWRHDLFSLIDRAQHLHWLTLTKRPQHIGRCWAEFEDKTIETITPRQHLWLGTSVGTERTAWEQIPHLTQWRHLSPCLFLSVEPLLEPIPQMPLEGIDWVIVGGESGGGARQMEESWVIDIQQQCQAAGVPFFFKQWGGVNKQRTGRELLGRTWDEIPQPRQLVRQSFDQVSA